MPADNSTALADTTESPGVHPLYLRLLGALLQQRGVTAPALMRESGIALNALDSDDAPISVSALQRLVAAGLHVSGSPWLGLELGAAAQVISHGPVGYAAAASGSLRQALDIATHFMNLRAPVLRMSLRHGARFTQLLVDENADLGSARRFVLEATAVMLERQLQSMAGRPLEGLRVAFPWPQPAWSAHYASYLMGDLEFGARRMILRFPNAVLDAPCVNADPQSFELLRQECVRRLQQGATERDLVSRIRRQLWGCEGSYPSAAAIADGMGLSLRALYRGLASAGSSFRSLLDDARSERAKRLLTDTNASIERIAERLGYADSSNFSRCFRRWTGQTPNAYRRGSLANR